MNFNPDEIFNKVEDLHPDLQEYLFPMGTWKVIQHPLVYSVPHSEYLNAMCNYRYEQAKKRLEEAYKTENYELIPFIYERAYRVNGFYEVVAQGLIPTDKEYWRVLSQVYIDTENLYQNYDIWEKLLFCSRPDNENFMNDHELEEFNKLPEEIIIYRGTRDNNWQGFSWTTDKSKAAWFANRFSGNAVVTTGKVKKSNVIGYLTGRGESEIVCHWKNVVKI